MRKIVLVLLQLVIANSIQAQTWTSLGEFNNGIGTFYADSAANELIIGGSFCYYNSDTIVGIARWNGSNMSTFGCGIEWNCIPAILSGFVAPVLGIVRYSNEIFVTGSFTYAGNKTVNGITKWDGNDWINFSTGLKLKDGDQGVGFGLKVIDNELYVYGVFDSIAGIAVNGLAKFDGLNWSTVHNFPKISDDLSGHVDFIQDIEHYNNELYVIGNFYNSSLGIYNIICWNGTDWVSVGNGIKGNIVFVNRILTYKNELIVAGLFSKIDNPDNPGTNIAKWDGTQWAELGGGVDGAIRDMKINNDNLYVCGAFHQAGGIEADRIARWDGTDWCGFATSIDNVVIAMSFYQDTLYIGGGFWTINGDSISRIAKWTGGSYVDTCGNTAGIEQELIIESEFTVYPNPASNIITVEFDLPAVQDATIEIHNVLGQVIITENYNALPAGRNAYAVDIGSIPTGIYFVVLQAEELRFAGKFVKE